MLTARFLITLDKHRIVAIKKHKLKSAGRFQKLLDSLKNISEDLTAARINDNCNLVRGLQAQVCE